MSFPTPEADTSRAEPMSPASEIERVVVPVIAEELRVGKRTVETERLIVRKTVEESEQVIDLPLEREEVTVETVPINRVVEGDIPSLRQEGDILIIPILREELVVRKVLILAEEIRIRRERRTVSAPRTVVVQREVAHVEQADAAPSPSAKADLYDVRANAPQNAHLSEESQTEKRS